jgi:HSP20 family molecular chaperone IbpA
MSEPDSMSQSSNKNPNVTGESTQQEFTRILQPGPTAFTLGKPGIWMPPIEMSERNGLVELRAEFPGMKAEDIKVEISDNSLILRGERTSEYLHAAQNAVRTERVYGSFYRVIPLPQGVIPDEGKAEFQNGLLTVVIPLAPQYVHRSLPVKSEPQTAEAVPLSSTSSTDFGVIRARHPELQAIFDRVAQWVVNHPEERRIDTGQLAAEMLDIPVDDLARALFFLVEEGYFRQYYAVLAPSGLLSNLDFDDPRKIPARLRDCLNSEFDTSNADVVAVLKPAA